jgi:hypothetical protein
VVVTLWGFTDRYSWIDAEYGPDDPLVYDDAYAKKPAYAGLLTGFGGALPARAANVLVNGDVSQGVTGWTSWGGRLGTSEVAKTGVGLVHTGRTAEWQGPVQSLLGKIDPSRPTIDVSAWVRVDAPIAPVRVTLAITSGGATSYRPIASVAASRDGFTLLSGNAALGLDSPPTRLDLYFEGPPPGVDLYVDDVSVVPLGP